jgi:hypothetical protein
MVYGILSVPFVFALLQQTMMDNEALDPYSPDHQLTRRAWVGGSTFLGAITLCCMLMFMVFDEDVWYVLPYWATSHSEPTRRVVAPPFLCLKLGRPNLPQRTPRRVTPRRGESQRQGLWGLTFVASRWQVPAPSCPPSLVWS